MPQIRIHNPKLTDMCTKSRRITTGFFLFYKVCQILIKDVITHMCCWYKQIDFTITKLNNSMYLETMEI